MFIPRRTEGGPRVSQSMIGPCLLAGDIAAAAAVVTVPPIVLVLLFPRHIIERLTQGASRNRRYQGMKG
ncbi:MAG: hypothetical protein EOS27_03620 [Mesorhizobium sp.]|nr:MAG: hypothetical protein EOS27_03620 [Mesorhizobium sp.]TIX28567.1 MAG: hypothetical protein E5V35_01355 [Mesorhizobium sp.]